MTGAAVANPECRLQAAATPADAAPNPKNRTRPKPQPPCAVILHNDDLNGFDFVIGALRKVFKYSLVKAFKLTLQAHNNGQSAVWSGSLEVAELKADQLRSCGADPRMRAHGALPLRASVMRLPG